MLKSNLRFALAGALLLAGVTLALAQQETPLVTQSEDQLIAVLKSDATQKEKADACRQLGVVGTKNAVPALAALLPDEKMNHMARYGLEPIPDPSVDVVFRASLASLKGRPLVGVIGSIGVRRDARAIDALAGLLADADPDVAQAAARALGKIGTADAAKPLRAALATVSAANQLAFCEGLFRCAESFVTAGQRGEAIALYDQLRALSGPHQVRAGGLRGAILARGKDGVPMLVQAIRGTDWILAAAAARTAMEMSAAEVVPALAADLSTLPADNQVLIISALGKIGNSAALPALFAAAKSGPKAVRVAAVNAIPAIGGASAVPVLVGLMSESDRELAQAAQDSLAALSGAEVDAAVVAMLTNGDTAQKLAALDLMGRRRMTKQLPDLLGIAGDADANARIRAAALKKAGELGSATDLPALLGLLMQLKGSQELDAAEQAVGAVCARMADPESSAAKIAGLLAEAQAAQKVALLRVLSAIGGGGALKAVRGAVGDSNAEVRKAAIRALGEWKTADAAPDLLALAKDAPNATDKMLCLRSYFGLADNPDLPADKRLAMCREAVSLAQATEEKKLLLAALGSISTQQAIAVILPYLEDAGTKAEAGAAIVSIADKLLKGQGASRAASRLIEPLDKVAQANAGTEVGKRATATLEQARKRAGGK
jgi:HEAT repeat protein